MFSCSLCVDMTSSKKLSFKKNVNKKQYMKKVICVFFKTKSSSGSPRYKNFKELKKLKFAFCVKPDLVAQVILAYVR